MEYNVGTDGLSHLAIFLCCSGAGNGPQSLLSVHVLREQEMEPKTVQIPDSLEQRVSRRFLDWAPLVHKNLMTKTKIGRHVSEPWYSELALDSVLRDHS